MALGLPKCLELNFRGFSYLKTEHFSRGRTPDPHIKTTSTPYPATPLWKCFSQQYHKRMVVGHAALKLTKPASKHRFFLWLSTTPSRQRTRCGIQPWSKRFRQWWTQSRLRTKRLSEARDRSKVHHSVKGPRLTTAHFILDRPVHRTVAVAASS